jgi:hypothetical protein
MTVLPGNKRMVVARFQDGKMLKGTTHDFFPNKAQFHVYQGGDEKQHAIAVPVTALKALFFVKTYQGNNGHRKSRDLKQATGQGRKIEVKFLDGETLAGFAMGYNPAKLGFFLTPSDPESNNTRIFVVNAAVSSARWL